MGTRADFYIGRGRDAKYLGSIFYDGFPDNIPEDIRFARNEEDFVEAVEKFIDNRDGLIYDAEKNNWPYPWPTSYLSDYSYAFDGVSVWRTEYLSGVERYEDSDGFETGKMWVPADMELEVGDDDDYLIPKGASRCMDWPVMGANYFEFKQRNEADKIRFKKAEEAKQSNQTEQ